MESQVLDEEHLELLSFERSKTWANIFDNYLQRDDGKELLFDEFDNIFKDEDEDDNDDGLNSDNEHAHSDEAEVDRSFDDVLDNEVLEDITNRTYGGCLNYRDVAMVPYICKDEKDKDEIKHLLDQTIPIITEHKRKWQEAGIDRILNTFDTKKIESQVGDWLRRNNSVYSDKSLCCASHSSDYKTNNYGYANKKSDGIQTNDDDSEVESLHSVDTARYIRSSRKRHGSRRNLSASCTTMTIKTYRMVKSKRDELRHKYGSGVEYDEDHRHHMQQLRSRRMRQQQQELQQSCNYKQHSHCVKQSAVKTCVGTQRRKQLRKRRSDSSMVDSSDSDSFDSSEISLCRSRQVVKMPPCCNYQHCDQSRSRSYCDYNKSRRSFTERNFRMMQRRQLNDDDWLPFIAENDCDCCNDNKLCRNVRHLANSSTEEWLVENCDSPKVMQVEKESSPPKRTRLNFSKSHHNSKHDKIVRENRIFKTTNRDCNNKEFQESIQMQRDSGSDNDGKNNCQVTKSNTVEDDTIIKNHSNKFAHKDNVKDSKKAKKHKITNRNTRSFSSDESETDLDAKRSASPPSKMAKKTKAALTLKTGKVCKTKNERKSKNVTKEEPADDFEAELQRAIELSKELYEKEKLKQDKEKDKVQTKKVKEKEKEKPKHKQKQSKELPNKNQKSDITEATFFNNISNICNSTVVNSNSVAGSKDGLSQPLKCLATTSAMQQNNNVTINSNKCNKNKKAKELEHDDCTIVSSTTGMDPQISAVSIRIKKMPDLKRQQEQQNLYKNAKPKDEISKKGILLYAPNERQLAPSSSFCNGFFTLTQEHLSSIIGENAARKFLKYYVGCRRFETTATIYYRPPEAVSVLSSESESDDDIFESADRYGELYVSLEKTT